MSDNQDQNKEETPPINTLTALIMMIVVMFKNAFGLKRKGDDG